jgi:hypothetical protein
MQLDRLLASFKLWDYRGWDPYDGLNSEVLGKVPFLSSRRLFRLAWIQLFKRLPINMRKPLRIRKGYNVKGLALILSGMIMLSKKPRYSLQDEMDDVIKLIMLNRTPGEKYYCWGYNFFWQARAFSVEPFKPNMIVSTFVAQAFLDYYDYSGQSQYLEIAIDVATFIRSELMIDETPTEICFGYIPGELTRVHNANLMGAKLFARLYSITSVQEFKDVSVKSTAYSIKRQNSDGSWYYGESAHHQWVDNFHTGFNLVAISEIQEFLGINYKNEISKGFRYHLNNHFAPDLTPKYYNNSLYPIDIHNYAQGIITFIMMEKQKDAKTLLDMANGKMKSQSGSYYYQKNRWYTNRINYFRWSQAWMFYATALLNSNLRHEIGLDDNAD